MTQRNTTAGSEYRLPRTAAKATLVFFNAALYAVPSVLAAVSQSNNFIRGTKVGYTHGSGYDCGTGLGTPAIAGLFALRVGI